LDEWNRYIPPRPWACLSPRNDESAGKRRSDRARKGSVWLKTTLVQCAWAAAKKKDSYLQEILPHHGSPGQEEGDPRGRGLDAHRHPSHAQGWNDVPGSRPQLPAGIVA